MKNKRYNGEGTVRLRSDGRWEARVYVNGKIKSFYSSKSDKEALKKMKLFLKNQEIGLIAENKQLMKTYADEWLKDKYKMLKRSSYDTVEWIVNIHIVPKVGDYALCDIDTKLLQNTFFDKSELSYSTLKKIHQALNQLFKKAIKNKLLIDNPVEDTIIPREKKDDTKQIQFLTEEQVNGLYSLMGKKWKTGKKYYQFDYAIIFLIYTGLRIGEALALKLSDYNPETNQISVNKNVKIVKSRNTSANNYERIIQTTPKTKKSNRKIYLGKKSLEAFKHMTENKKTDDYVITNSCNSPPVPGNLTRTLYSMLDAFNYEHIGLHALRHTFASMLIKNKTDIKIVSELLGHSSVSFTYDTYVHVLDEQKEEAISQLDNL